MGARDVGLQESLTWRSSHFCSPAFGACVLCLVMRWRLSARTGVSASLWNSQRARTECKRHRPTLGLVPGPRIYRTVCICFQCDWPLSAGANGVAFDRGCQHPPFVMRLGLKDLRRTIRLVQSIRCGDPLTKNLGSQAY